MQNKNVLKLYEQYLNMITVEIEKMFEAQKEYICCKNGCSLCCEDGMYPFSEIEFEYIKTGLEALPKETYEAIRIKCEKLRGQAVESEFLYECPFLMNGSCSVYQKRGLICRTFGLITENDTKQLTIPYCAEYGLNYSKVYDKDTQRIYEEKVKELGYSTLPRAYNLSRHNLMYGLAENLNFDWGETKPLINWLLEYFDIKA